jgi:hypothetical protein
MLPDHPQNPIPMQHWKPPLDMGSLPAWGALLFLMVALLAYFLA